MYAYTLDLFLFHKGLGGHQISGQVSAHEVYVTAQEGLYRLETVITVAAEEKRRDKVVARAIGITSPCFEFAG